MIIAVDFDGTIVENRYPQIGKPILFAIETLIQLQKERHLLILWTVREGEALQDAIHFCASKGLYFYAHNANYPEGDAEDAPRKLKADLFIDDRNLGGLPDWGVIYNAIQATVNGEDSFQAIMSANALDSGRKAKKGFFSSVFGK
ncbi:MAG: hypothetical protein LBR48_00890 [Dysgonamonadaceae bacterium]|jgi:hypothetical protein|nr:hypothetical protein [Dysgonamonadaceae bacterium]